MYLYILPFKDHDVLKIGISEDFKRIFYLNTVYPLDLPNALIFSVKDAKAIKSMEGHLLALTQKYYAEQFWYKTSYKKKTFPGRTELRTKQCLVDICKFLYAAQFLHEGVYQFLCYNYTKCSCCGAEHQSFRICKDLSEVNIYIPALRALNLLEDSPEAKDAIQ